MLSNTLWNISLTSCLLVATIPPLSAQDVKPPLEVMSSMTNPILSGSANFSVFLFHIYDAALWVEKKPWSFNQKFSLSLYYKRDITKEEFVDNSISEMKRYDNLGPELSRYREKLTQIFPKVVSGDRISAIYDPKKGLKFFYNGRSIGEIQDKTFAKRFINIWLHPNAYYDSFRRKLLFGRE